MEELGEWLREQVMQRWNVIALVLLLVFGVYMAIYILGFDKDTRCYDSSGVEVEYMFAPKWKEPERRPYDISLYGKRASTWNTLFWPADALYRMVKGD